MKLNGFVDRMIIFAFDCTISFKGYFYFNSNTLIMKLKTILAFLCVVVTVSSCITFEEIYSFNSDGSGTMQYVIDFTEYAEIFESLNDETESTSEEEEEDPMAEMTNVLKEKITELQSIDGVSDAKVVDKGKYVFCMQYKFSNLVALNKALNLVKNEMAEGEHEFFALKGKKIIHKGNFGDLGETLREGNEDEESQEMMAMVMDQMKYNLTIQFASPVKSVKTGGPGSLDASKKEFKVTTTFTEILNNQSVFDSEFKR